jgi:hypothetical protein
MQRQGQFFLPGYSEATMKTMLIAAMLLGNCFAQTAGKSFATAAVMLSNGRTDGQASYYNCSSHISGDRWKTMGSAPKNGAVVELAQTYGLAPTYGLYKWVRGSWQSVSDEHKGMSQDCAYWRPVKGAVKSYVDPTGGKQDTIKYWCDAMHVKHDPKKDRCVW